MASTRLKMLLPAYLPRLQQLDSRIRQIVIKQKTQNPEVKREKSFRISPNAVQYFAQTTKRVAHYPELAQALENLVQHHQNENNNQM